MKLQLFNTCTFGTSAKSMFGSMPDEERALYYPENEFRNCRWALRSLIINNKEKLILVDTGFNIDYDKTIIKDYSIKEHKTIAQKIIDLGFECNMITDVLHTHLHLDHCGGTFNVDPKSILKLTFPKSRCIVSHQQLSSALNPSDFEREAFQAGIVNAVNETENLVLVDRTLGFFPEIEFRFFYGHTSGLVVPLIHNQNHTFAFVGDLIPSAAHIFQNAIAEYDVDPAVTHKEKRLFLEESFQKKYILIFQHDLYHECCTLQKIKNQIVPAEFFKLESYF